MIEVSHWGNIAVEETLDVLHTGAKLKGPFSRYDYQREHNSYSSIKWVLLYFPSFDPSLYFPLKNVNIIQYPVTYIGIIGGLVLEE